MLLCQSLFFEWFQAVTMELANNNRRKASGYMRKVRERIGIAIVRGQGRVVDELNNQNRRWGSNNCGVNDST